MSGERLVVFSRGESTLWGKGGGGAAKIGWTCETGDVSDRDIYIHIHIFIYFLNYLFMPWFDYPILI